MHLNDFYRDVAGNRKLNGIYCPSFDRWLLLDENDFWITMETANVLSSKVATVVYILPRVSDMSSENCFEFTISNKTVEKRSGAADLIASQLPSVRVLRHESRIIREGLPKDFESSKAKQALVSLKSYTEFVHKQIYAIELATLMMNHEKSETFVRRFFSSECLKGFSKSRRSKSPQDLAVQMKRVLYACSRAEEAQGKMDSLLKIHANSPFFAYRYFVESYRSCVASVFDEERNG